MIYRLKVNRVISKEYLYFSIIFLLLALRHPSMGIDLGYSHPYGYLSSFDYIAALPISSVLRVTSFQNYEYGYILFNKLVSIIYPNRQLFLATSAFLSIYPFAVLVKRYSRNEFLSFIIFLGLPMFLIAYSGLRQSIAIGITMYSFKFIIDKKLIKFILTVFLASSFHYSSILFLSAYPVFHLKMNRYIRSASVLVIPLFVVFRFSLFNIFSRLLKQGASVDNNASFTLLLVFTLIYILLQFFAYKNNESIGFSNLFYIACLVQALASVNSIVLRVGYYFMPYLCIALPNLIVRRKKLSVVEYRAWFTIVVICFSVFGLYSIYSTYWAQAYPYKFFFQRI